MRSGGYADSARVLRNTSSDVAAAAISANKLATKNIRPGAEYRPGDPDAICTVDVTPRRLQKLKIKPGQRFRWTNTAVSDGEQLQAGAVVADKHGLVTMEKVIVTKHGNRILLTRVQP